MAYLKDIARLADGLSLVAKEAVNRQLRHNNLQSLIKKTLLSATDLTGLTKGKVRQIDKEIGGNSAVHPDSNKQSVVYFGDEKLAPLVLVRSLPSQRLCPKLNAIYRRTKLLRLNFMKM